MSEFKNFAKELAKNVNKLIDEGGWLYRLEVDKDEFWDFYLDSYPAGTNDIFRERRVHDCQCCKHFIRRFGQVVVIKNGKRTSIWENLNNLEEPYKTVADKMADYLKNKPIADVYVPYMDYKNVGNEYTYELDENEKIVFTWNHFHYSVPDTYINKFKNAIGYSAGNSIPEIQGSIRDSKNVLKRSLEEITDDAVQTVYELICAGSIYRGDEWKSNIETFRDLRKVYSELKTDVEKDIFCWEKAITVPPTITRIKNHSMGTLLSNVSEGMNLDAAVKAWETVVAGPNYKRPKPLFTQKMLDSAKKKISELGFMDSLKRRYAVLDDISVNDILFCNKNAATRIKHADDIFDQMSKDATVNPKSFSKVEEIDINKFVNDILPTAKEIELYLDNKLTKNLVSLIGPENSDSKSMFKWDNSFSWAYTGNITDSNIKANVEKAGGNVTGDVRFSIQWNDDPDHWDEDDLDAHCKEITKNGKYEIYYGNRSRTSPNGGKLDIDITRPLKSEPAVENIFYTTKSTMTEGTYQFFVHQYCNRGGKTGFKAQLEVEGAIYDYEYPHPIKQDTNIQVAEVTVNKDKTFTVKDLLPASTSSRTVWNMATMQFHPVTVIMNSPNYWEGSSMTGNKHWFFMIDNAINSECPNGFYNEFLVPELNEHRHVLEALGQKLSVVEADDQLSGVGFSSTLRNEVILRVTSNSTKRILKVKF